MFSNIPQKILFLTFQNGNTSIFMTGNPVDNLSFTVLSGLGLLYHTFQKGINYPRHLSMLLQTF